MSEPRTYPIAEEFSSIQGEGCFAGTPMRFIRLAGCSVGVYESLKETKQAISEHSPDLRLIYPRNGDLPKHAVCESTFGEKFICDTNYKMAWRKTVVELLEGVKEEHICLTGGEPFNHQLGELLDASLEAKKMVHIETSGTIDIRPTLTDRPAASYWITCSPKKGFFRQNVPLVSEWKFVVGANFQPRWIEEFFNYSGGRAAWSHPVRPVFLQPVNFIERPDMRSINRVLQILNDHPGWRLSAQLHKFLELR